MILHSKLLFFFPLEKIIFPIENVPIKNFNNINNPKLLSYFFSFFFFFFFFGLCSGSLWITEEKYSSSILIYIVFPLILLSSADVLVIKYY